MDETRCAKMDWILYRWIFIRRCPSEWFRNEWSVVWSSSRKTYLISSLLFSGEIGKALLLLTEDNFKKRSSRSGDILHKALQQHRAMLKALHCQSRLTENDFDWKKPHIERLFSSLSIPIMEQLWLPSVTCTATTSALAVVVNTSP